MRIALVLPKAAPETLFYGDDFRMEPMGLLYLSAYLMNERHKTVVINQSLRHYTQNVRCLYPFDLAADRLQ